MTKPRFDQDFWEQLWSTTLREHADKPARRPPNAHLMAEAANLPPGRALDAGCGHGADTLWLAAHGWQVTAVDFSAAALAHGRSMARSCWDRCRRAHRLDRERSRDLDGGAGALRSRCLLVRPRGRLRGRHGGADGERRRSGRDLVPGRTPPDRSQHRSCHGCGKSGASLSRGCGRCARFQCVGVGRRRGASARRRRHWCRCSDPRAPPDLSHSGDAQQRYPKS